MGGGRGLFSRRITWCPRPRSQVSIWVCVAAVFGRNSGVMSCPQLWGHRWSGFFINTTTTRQLYRKPPILGLGRGNHWFGVPMIAWIEEINPTRTTMYHLSPKLSSEGIIPVACAEWVSTRTCSVWVWVLPSCFNVKSDVIPQGKAADSSLFSDNISCSSKQKWHNLLYCS